MLEWMLQEEQREPRAFRRRARRWRHPSSQRDFRRPTRCERESWRRPRGRHHPPWQELTTLAWRGGSRRTWSKRKMWRVEWMLGPHGVQNWRNVTSCCWLINEAESVNGSCYVVRCLVYTFICVLVWDCSTVKEDFRVHWKGTGRYNGMFTYVYNIYPAAILDPCSCPYSVSCHFPLDDECWGGLDVAMWFVTMQMQSRCAQPYKYTPCQGLENNN